MTKKNIVILTNTMDCGGTQRVISRLLPSFNKLYNVHLLLLNKSDIVFPIVGNLVELGVEEPANRILYATDLYRSGKKLKAFIKDNNIDTVISFLGVPDILNLCFNNKAKKIINIRCEINLKEKGFSAKVKNGIRKAIYKKTDKVIVPSLVLKREMEELFDVSSEKINLVYNPFDFEEIERLSQEEISEKSLFEEKYVICAMGRLDQQKGFINLILAIKNVISKHNQVRLFIMGEGSQRALLERLIRDNNLCDYVILKGNCSNPFKYIKKSKIFVLSSFEEGFPNALVEAMGCGIPVISTDCKTGPREILYENPDIDIVSSKVQYADYGVLIPPFSKEYAPEGEILQLDNAICSLIEDESMRDEYARKAREKALQYTVDKCVLGYREVIGI